MSQVNSSTRFSATVEYYHQFRPSYPNLVIEQIKEKCSLHENSIIADIGAGTGIFSEQLAHQGVKVYAIEPNQAMRAFGQSRVTLPNIEWLDGQANYTTLESESMDCITCAQAFHWFNNDETYQEFKRILKPKGYIVLLWNFRENSSDFMRAYEELLTTFGTDYRNVAAENIDDAQVAKFFNHNKFKKIEMANHQTFDLTSFEGRLQSTSYTPKPPEQRYEEMMQEAKTIFDIHQDEDCKVKFEYLCTCYIGQL